MPEDPLERLRAIIEALPDTSEKLSHGAPTWWGSKKTFACFHAGGYDEGRPGVWIKLPEGMQAALIEEEPARFYRPKYLGHKGWVGLRLSLTADWAEVEALLIQGYRLVAHKRAIARLDDPSG